MYMKYIQKNHMKYTHVFRYVCIVYIFHMKFICFVQHMNFICGKIGCVPTKFEASGSKPSKITCCTKCGRLAYQLTDIRRLKHMPLLLFFFGGGGGGGGYTMVYIVFTRLFPYLFIVTMTFDLLTSYFLCYPPVFTLSKHEGHKTEDYIMD